ncbi:MAG TPA: DISARM system helicase DrmA [Polyangiaceae bacterium]|nr:DISARM system helicase DrmA [Polyangiaceae bacterium]
MMTTPADVRAFVLRALEADLVGPFRGPGSPEPELLPLPPSRFYLTGFLVPKGARASEEPEDDDLDGQADEEDSGDAEAGSEAPPKQRQFLPSSCGMSFLLPEGPDSDTLEVSLSWAEYTSGEPYTVLAKQSKKRGGGTVETEKKGYLRKPLIEKVLLVSLGSLAKLGKSEKGLDVPGTDGVVIVGRMTRTKVGDTTVRAVSLFVENAREAPEEDRELREEKTLFQVELRVAFAGGILARDTRSTSLDRDGRIADLQFRDVCEYAVGHGVSVRVLERHANGPDRRALRVGTCFVPRAEVKSVRARTELSGETVETRMGELAKLTTGPEVERALGGLPRAYEAWITAMEARGQELPEPHRREVSGVLAGDARRARARIEEGIRLLATNDEARRVFAWANRCMADAARRTRPNDEPSWRLFQLGFLLLALPSTLDGGHPDRETVELIYFPTGGGKTEAYLGLIACVLLARRLRGRGAPDEGLGVAVLLRYTLRLLTLDQLERAARLVCALEVLRREVAKGGGPRSAELGTSRFSIGLWVGRSATANTFKVAKLQVDEWKDQESGRSPLPIGKCPWCDTLIAKNQVTVDARDDEVAVRVMCDNFRACPFASGALGDGLGIPVLFVDEHIYRELPAFLLSTVDKFAMVPWRAEAGLLFGQATHRLAGVPATFLGPTATKIPKDAKRLAHTPTGATGATAAAPGTAAAAGTGATGLVGLHPPELVVQDELHLISGPLGTIVGLYETAIGALLSRTRPPKILASTATVKRAEEQVRAIFGRAQTDVYPPAGMDDGETFFAEVAHDQDGRLYAGVSAAGRSQKQLLIRVYVALLAAAQLAHEAGIVDERGQNVADGYATLVGYFNSLRELGGMRRLCDDDVLTRLELRASVDEAYGRVPVDWPKGEPHPFARTRALRETIELTSREQTATIADHKTRLGHPYAHEAHVDVVLASNMISVGVDIPRLGLMVVAGQPKTVSEYIQATSRVGRGKSPGLVVTCLSAAKARDRSHYERFEVVHESFYRFVEAQSLTPFSDQALRRALAGAVLALARHADVALTPGPAAMDIACHPALAERIAETFAVRAKVHARAERDDEARLTQNVRDGVLNLLGAWKKVVGEHESKLRYSPLDGKKTGDRSLLFTKTDADPESMSPDARRFAAGMSMRDVEASTHVWLDRNAR